MVEVGKPFWFLNAEVTIQLAAHEGVDGTSVMLFRHPRDDAPPLHVHHAEDEIFHVLEGEIRFLVGGAARVARAGNTVLGPRGLPHGFRILSERAAMLVITRGAFERMVRSLARPALAAGPPTLAVPDAAMQRLLSERCAAENIELLGPPID